MAWQQLIARVPRDKVAEIETLLELAGAVSIALEDAAEAPLFEPLPGETPLWPVVAVKALFDADVDVRAVRGILAGTAGDDVRIEAVGDEDVAPEAGRFAPMRIGGRLWLLSADDATPDEEVPVLRLNRGLAFGTGEHPTTALCLDWIASSLEPGTVVLDYGCGSGILALAALRLGAVRAFAVDNDPQAVAAAKANAALNGLADKIWVGPPEALPGVRADVVLANILARPLMELSASFRDRLVTGGRAILSGVLAAQRAELERAYAPSFEIDGAAERDGWIRLDISKRAGACSAKEHPATRP